MTPRKLSSREKTVRRPDPRYPLTEVSTIWKEYQVRTQNECHQILQAALNGNFTVKRSEADFTVAFTGPRSTDLEFGKEYEVNVNGKVFKFEWEGLNPIEHSIPEGHPTSCLLFWSMEEHLNDGEFINYRLHNIAAVSYTHLTLPTKRIV